MKKQLIYYIFPFIFLVCASAPFWGLSFYKNAESHEKRAMTNIHEVKSFTGFKAFLMDNHAFRDILFETCMDLYVNIFKESPLPKQAVLGKDGWLFLGNNHLEVYSSCLGIVDISDNTVNNTCTDIAKIKEFCDSINTDFIIAIAPNKGTIYPEYLPLQPNSRKRLRNLVKPKLADMGIHVIDLTDTIISKKNENILYYKGDSHWNNLGAFIGLQKLLSDISKTQHIDKPVFESYSVTEGINTKATQDLADMLSIKQADTYFEITTKETPRLKDTLLIQRRGEELLSYVYNESGKNETKAFVIHDSFYHSVYKPFASSVKETSVFRYFNRSEILKEIERTGNPDFIVVITVERNLNALQERSFD